MACRNRGFRPRHLLIHLYSQSNTFKYIYYYILYALCIKISIDQWQAHRRLNTTPLEFNYVTYYEEHKSFQNRGKLTIKKKIKERVNSSVVWFASSF